MDGKSVYTWSSDVLHVIETIATSKGSQRFWAMTDFQKQMRIW